MRRTLTSVALAAALLGGCKSEQAVPGAVKLVVEFQGFRPECVRVTAWDADAPDKRDTRPVKPTSVVGPLQAPDKRGELTVAVFRGADWSRNLRMSAEAFETGACDGDGKPLAGREAVAIGDSGTVVTQDGKVSDDVRLSLSALDTDGDGYVSASGAKPGRDCNDANAQAFPGAPEVCNGLDDNCDEGKQPDEGLQTTPWYLDDDGDTYGATASRQDACRAPGPKYIARGGDCADTGVGAASIHPGATEVCDGIDNNCDPERRLDEGLPTTAWYLDEDGDSYGATASRVDACKAPGTKYVSRGGDCRDTGTSAAISYPGASEACDGIDNNCDPASPADQGFDVNAACSGGNICQGTKVCAPDGKATVCQGEVFQELWYPDGDGDTKHGGTGVSACTAPAGHSKTNADCNDGDPFTYNGANEICDGRDNDCNPATSDSDPAVCPAGGGSYASVSTGLTGGFNWRSVATWNGGVWMVGEAGRWARRAAGQSSFTTGSCGSGSNMTWYSVWIDPRQGGSVYYGGTNELLAVIAQNGTTCATNPPKINATEFTTRGLVGFTPPATGPIQFHGVGNADTHTGKTFFWDGVASPVSPSSASFIPLRDVHGLSESTLFAVAEPFGTVPAGKVPIYRFNTSTRGWDLQDGPAAANDKSLLGVHVVNPKLAYAVGQGGTVLKWNGTSWQLLPSSGNAPTGTLRAVLAFGEASVYVVSQQSGSVFRYNGTTWEKLATMTDVDMSAVALYDIAGTSPADIWVVGESNHVYHWPQ